jgi:hypothetical protein
VVDLYFLEIQVANSLKSSAKVGKMLKKEGFIVVNKNKAIYLQAVLRKAVTNR